MNSLIAADFLASAEKSTIPGWVSWVVIGLVGFIGGGFARRIPKVRDTPRFGWLQWTATLVGGGVAGAIAWCDGNVIVGGFEGRVAEDEVNLPGACLGKLVLDSFLQGSLPPGWLGDLQRGFKL
ncbi:MAG: hypothetical protein AB7G47_13930 [Mycolicibacterium sp.]|uniref:hypothetical protein n=1 Tax=Mycolicibacterium sp. TaxID=2320850 RepID=UPI003D0ED6D8